MDPKPSGHVRLARIQIRTYRKTYLTKRKGDYQCRSYFVYIPKALAEPLVGKDLKLTKNNSGIIIEPRSAWHDAVHVSHVLALLGNQGGFLYGRDNSADMIVSFRCMTFLQDRSCLSLCVTLVRVRDNWILMSENAREDPRCLAHLRQSCKKSI